MSGSASSPGGTDANVALINLAASLIGMAFNSFFFGLITMQTAYYWRHYWKKDGLYLRSMVMLVAVLTAFHMACLMCSLAVWNRLILSHAGPSVRGFPWWTRALITANVVGMLAVHSFYLNRLWTLSRNKIFVTVLGVLMLEVFALGIYTPIYATTHPTASTLANIIREEAATCASLVVMDVTVTTSLITLFLRLSNRGMPESQHLVKRLIFYTLTTGMLTAICAVVAFITNLKFPKTIISPVFYDLSASLYGCSFLSSLNARQSLLGKLMETSTTRLNTGSATMPYFPRLATSGGTFASGLTTTGNSNV